MWRPANISIVAKDFLLKETTRVPFMNTQEFYPLPFTDPRRMRLFSTWDGSMLILEILKRIMRNPSSFSKNYWRISLKALGANEPKSGVGLLQENEKLNQTIEAFNRMDEKSKQIDRKMQEWEQAREPFLLSQKFLAGGNYEGALKENQRILSLFGQDPPGDEALFNMGLIYAHPGNPKKDYVKSLTFF